jgi:hypothetical protein
MRTHIDGVEGQTAALRDIHNPDQTMCVQVQPVVSSSDNEYRKNALFRSGVHAESPPSLHLVDG